MKVFDKARTYLLSLDGVDEQLIDSHVKKWDCLKKSSLKEIYRSLLHHSQNRQGMPNSIGEIDRLSRVFFDFDPKEVACNYKTYHDVLDSIKDEGVETSGVIRPENERSHWVVFAKASIVSSNFLGQFEGIDDFNNFVHHFYRDKHTLISLPLMLKEELFGFGFALACDFLKENGYEKFVKPDTHINDICRAAGITNATTDYGVFKDVVDYCSENNLVPYEFDKMIWLVGSGRFYLNNKTVSASKKYFIENYL